MITFTDFRRLYSEAANTDIDTFISEHAQKADTLTAIHSMANGGAAAIVETSGLSKAAFCRMFNIPKNSLLSWTSETRQATDYLLLLLAYVVFNLKFETK